MIQSKPHIDGHMFVAKALTVTITLQSGFNAGDGFRFFVIPGSRTNNILSLPSTSNVARCGQWMFRTDEAIVDAGACYSRGTIVWP